VKRKNKLKLSLEHWKRERMVNLHVYSGLNGFSGIYLSGMAEKNRKNATTPLLNVNRVQNEERKNNFHIHETATTFLMFYEPQNAHSLMLLFLLIIINTPLCHTEFVNNSEMLEGRRSDVEVEVE
jgi:hypothetical protein